MIFTGTPISGGYAVGKLFIFRPSETEVAESHIEPSQAQEEVRRLRACFEQADKELAALSEKLGSSDKGAIFEAHRDLLQDEVMQEEVFDAVENGLCSGDWAVQQVYGKYADMLGVVDDELIRQRAADLLDVAMRVIRIYRGESRDTLSALPGPVVLAAHDLTPSDTAALDRDNVLAILTEVGGATSHTAIIARSWGIPAVLGIQGLLESCADAELAAVDACSGRAQLDPSAEERARFLQMRESFLAQAAETAQYLERPALTADGVKIDIGLNIGSLQDSVPEHSLCADFVGLFRTEFLYMQSSSLPDEAQQESAYRHVLRSFAGKPVTLRTLDIGGDKTLDCMELPREDNPFLGSRALRLCFSRPELFRTQLRAALKAAQQGELWLMLPMVSSIDDIRRAKAFIDETRSGLEAEGCAVGPVKVGIMVETPSIAVLADLAAREADFASIGTNDLCQYLMAADRLNPLVSEYYQPYNPAMFRVIKTVIDAFNRENKPVSVCGEMGGDPLAAAVLVGLGLRKLSMSRSSVAKVKKMLSALTIDKARALAEQVLDMETAAQVEELLRRQIKL